MIAVLAKIAGIVGLLGSIPYVFSILNGKTIPNPATWWIWSIVGWIAFFSYFAAGETETYWLMLSYAIGPSVIGLLSFRYGRVSALEKFDIGCLFACSISLILWQNTANPLIALFIMLGIDIMGALPTIRKTYVDPDTEDVIPWLFFCAGNTLNFFSILIFEEWNVVSIPYPLYLFILSFTMLSLASKGSGFRLWSK